MDLGYPERFHRFQEKARSTPNLVNISLCDPPRFGFKPDPSVLEGLSKVSHEQGYPDTRKELLDGIADRTKSFTGTSVDTEDIIITNGVGGAFSLLSIALRGSSVGIESPVYSPIYEFFSRTTDLWFLRCTPKLDWGLDLDQVRKGLEARNSPGYLVLVTPSNPTGNVHDEKTMKGFIDLAGEFDQVVISDEVYDEMSYVPFTSALSVSKDVPVIYLHGFSKVWRAPEIRIGFTILHDPEEKITDLQEELKNISYLGFGVNPHSQLAGTLLLKERQAYRQRQFDEMRRRRDTLNKAVEASDNLSSVEGKGATYQFVKTPWNDWKVSEKLLSEYGIYTVPGSLFDDSIGNHYLRIVFLNTHEVLTESMEILDSLNP
jgi:aspartate aminotransferase